MDDQKRKDILQYFEQKNRPDLRNSALEIIIGLSASDEGLEFLFKTDEFLQILCEILTSENESEDLVNRVLFLLLNISSSERICGYLISGKYRVVPCIYKMLLNCENIKQLDLTSKILCNLTRLQDNCKKVWENMKEVNCDECESFNRLLEILCQSITSSEYEMQMEYIPILLSNLAQLDMVRRLLERNSCAALKTVLPLLDNSSTDITYMQKYGLIGTIRNCCFDTAFHRSLLSDDVDLLSKLLLPLAGNDELEDDEMDKLPIDLQYLPDDKKREDNPDLRKMLIESLIQLCATSEGRECLRNNGVYYVIRELDRWEQNKESKTACLDLIDMLIKKESEINVDNLKQLDIPEKYIDTFAKIDKEISGSFSEN